MNLHKNMGLADRMIRPAAAAAIIATSFAGKIKEPFQTGLLFLSGILLVTSATGSCPAYEVMNVDSRSTK